MIETHPVFKGLTRPSMKWGVVYEVMVMNILTACLLFTWTNSFWVFVAAASVHGLFYLACQKDPDFF